MYVKMLFISVVAILMMKFPRIDFNLLSVSKIIFVVYFNQPKQIYILQCLKGLILIVFLCIVKIFFLMNFGNFYYYMLITKPLTEVMI